MFSFFRFFPYIYNLSGVEAAKEKFGDWFDYNLNPRSQIFKRDHNNVVDMQTLVKLMRFVQIVRCFFLWLLF